MKKISRLKINNSGSMLVIVIISMAFIGILASLVLSVSLTNLQTKYVDTQAKTNFYSAEIALDEIQTGLQAIISNKLEAAYLQVLGEYADLPTGDRNEKLKEFFLTNVQASLWQGDASTYDKAHYSFTTLRDLLDNAGIAVIGSTATGNNELEFKNTAGDPDEQYVIIKNLRIEYKNPTNNYYTKITTDIKIVPPDIQFESVVSKPSYCEYVLISNKTISANVPVVKCEVNGSVYAQDKILAKSQLTELIIKAENVVTRNVIEIADGAKLSIGDATKPTKIWARNIETTGTSSEPTEGMFQGDCYIQDDLTLGVKTSNVSFLGGYYGYSYGDTAATSSSMIINRSNCTLNLKDLKMLFLGGRSFISKENAGSPVEVTTGESITSKMNQNAYLLPGNSILKLDGSPMGHNPLLPGEKIELFDSVSPQLSVDMSYPSYKGKELSYYASGSKVIYDNDGVIYFYLVFHDEKKANEYYAAYYEENTESIDAALTEYGTKILIDTDVTPFSRLTNAGNIVLLNDTNSEILNSSVTSFLPSAFVNEAQAIAKQYKAMQEKLLLTTTNIHIENVASLFETLIDETSLVDRIEYEAGLGATYASYPYYDTDGVTLLGEVILINDPTIEYKVDASPTVPTIIITTGDVDMNCDVFNGLVIAKGNIKLTKSMSTISADNEMVYKIITQSDAKSVFRDFQGYTVTSVAGGVTSSKIETDDLITFQNWKKN